MLLKPVQYIFSFPNINLLLICFIIAPKQKIHASITQIITIHTLINICTWNFICLACPIRKFTTPPPIRWESDLALSADVIFAASQGLIDHLSPCSDNIVLLPNGVNYSMFAQPNLRCPPELRDISGPVLGYVGTLWRDLDLAPALLCAQYMPRWTFVFLGRRERNPALEPLSVLPNVRLLDPCNPGEVPDFLSRFDVCMSFPRMRDPDNDVVPTRIYEYFAAGKPVVAFYRRGQVEPFPDVIYAAYTAREFARLCRQALSEAGDWFQARRRSRGEVASWSHRAEQVQQILETVGLFDMPLL